MARSVLNRDLDDNDAKFRAYVKTGDRGYFYYRATAYASRLYQFAWAAHVNDARYTANGYVTLRARATATLKASPSPALVPSSSFGLAGLGASPSRNAINAAITTAETA